MVSERSTTSNQSFMTAKESQKSGSTSADQTLNAANETVTSPLRAAAARLEPSSKAPVSNAAIPTEAAGTSSSGRGLGKEADQASLPQALIKSSLPLESNPALLEQQPVASFSGKAEQNQQPTATTEKSNSLPGSSHFSVPPASPPSKGVYVFPQEAFVISDLDTGRKFEVNKDFWIKDVDTGSVYVVEEGATNPAAAADARAAVRNGTLSSEATSQTRSPSPLDDGNDVQITDLMSGQKLSVQEFEAAMGYLKVPENEALTAPLTPQRTVFNPGPATASSPYNSPSGKVEQIAQKSLLQLSTAASASAAWMKEKAAFAFSRVGSGKKEHPISSFNYNAALAGAAGASSAYGGTNTAASGRDGASHLAATASPSGSMHGGGHQLPDPNGIPVKVTVHRKSVKELADLRLVQEIQGHQGVVWAMKFNRNGRYLATAGQDCVIRIWEAIPNRGSSSSTSLSNPTSPGATPPMTGSGTPLQPGSPRSQQAHAGGGGGVVTNMLGEGPLVGGTSSTGASSPHGSSAGGTGPFGSDHTAGSPIGSSNCPGVAVLKARPYKTYRGHKQDVLDVAWSRTHFLLSASMDKTVRLWHVTVDECLRVFKHSDFVTAIDFHPSDDKLFVSGSIDGKVRLWNVPDQRVMSWQDVHEMVTAVGYGRDAARAAVGTMRGKCRFYAAGERTGLEYEAQLDVKNKRGQHARGKKVTGVLYSPVQPGSLLVTSNDSRIRLYDGYALRCKFKGHTNRSTQIRASFSSKGDYVICGSDTGGVYIWNTNKNAPLTGFSTTKPTSEQPSSSTPQLQPHASPGPPTAKEKNSSYESFQVSSDIVTVAIFAPESSIRSTAASGSSASGTSGVVDQGIARTSGSTSVTVQQQQQHVMMWPGRGQVILAAGYGGEIKIYENMAVRPVNL